MSTMLTIRDALSQVLREVPLLTAEEVGLYDAFDRVAAEDVFAPSPVPPWDNSAMDGYAVRAVDVQGPCTLELKGVVGAGTLSEQPVEAGCAVAIMTGAPVPPGADSIVIIENTDGAEEGTLTIRAAVEHKGQHIRRKGNDIQAGDRVVRAGQRLTPARVGLLASVGASVVKVRRKPTVAILATGSEIIRPGRALGPGEIYSSNPYTLAGLVRSVGATSVDLGDVEDDLDSLVSAMERGLACDVLLTTGGVSMGRFDLVKPALARLGVSMDFWKVKMKPGKPLAFGVAERDGRSVPIFGLPGNPVSCMVNFHEFVHPWIQRALGDEAPYLPVVEATMGEDIAERPGRAKLIRVTLESGPGGWVARSTGNQSSGALTSMARAHGLLMLSERSEGVQCGERVRVQLLDPSFLHRTEPALPE